MVKKFNSIIISSLILIFLLSAKVISLPESNLITLAVLNDLSKIEGKLISNPVKSSDKYYSVILQVTQCESLKNEKFSVCGKQKFLVPAQIIEAFYPDKLFSKNKNTGHLLPLEQGIIIKAAIKTFSTERQETIFIIDNIITSSYENSFRGNIYKFRGYCRIQFKRLMKDWGRAGGFLLALLSGSKEYLDSKISNAFRQSGLSHILALSGMHLSLISSIAGILENKSALKKLGLLLKVGTIILFVWFAGISPSLFRALISCLLISACTFFNIPDADNITLLGTTFLVHMAFRPADFFNLGFLFSYCALLGILIFSTFIKSKCSIFMPGYIGESFSSSVSSNLFTAPVCLKYFGFYSPSGIICTIFISPLITIFLYCGIICMILCFFIPDFCYLTSHLLNFCYNIIIKIVDFFSFIPVISISNN
ncbi:MAG: ComEC/Rec2 family competence protein [Treponema sp.]|uniref:ComEC/Rec2 family competence protein n=1 Tax=Treponema sp. TaxID=166 RepID=UPI00298E13E8|nr:ComEC/Rec2 family competence protein [Treponema sp.]MCQ2600100.1 ComEC/Rec2 family competence protein [Treponema sp.]